MNRINRSRRIIGGVLAAAIAMVAVSAHATETLSIAAASDLQFALRQVVQDFEAQSPDTRVQLTFGSSGKFSTQIRQGAPFDVFFSADFAYAQVLVEAGLTVGGVRPYATGRIVLWSAQEDASALTLQELTSPRFARVAIANPRHAPYGQRAEEALRATGIWDALQPRLVYGENISQTAQFVRSGNAQVGIVALSLVLAPALQGGGGYALIPDTLHAPLEQGYVVLRGAKSKASAQAFVRYLESAQARATLARYGFAPGGPAVQPAP